MSTVKKKEGDRDVEETHWEIMGACDRPVPHPDSFDFNELRKTYVKRAVEQHDQALAKEFRDSHGFRVLFRPSGSCQLRNAGDSSRKPSSLSRKAKADALFNR